MLKGQGEGRDALFFVPEEVPETALVDLVFGSVKYASQAEKWEYLGRYVTQCEHFRTRIYHSYDAVGKIKRINGNLDVRQMYLDDMPMSGVSIREHISKIARAVGCESSSVLIPQGYDELNGNVYSSICLSGLRLIDVSKASWEQIVELRRDTESVKKLRNLRLFFFNNYQGRSVSYVADDLAKRIDDYDRVRQGMGFESVLGSLEVLLNSKALHAAATAGLIAGFLGGPVVGVSSAVLLELSAGALSFAKRRQAISNFESAHDLAYVIKLRETFGQSD